MKRSIFISVLILTAFHSQAQSGSKSYREYNKSKYEIMDSTGFYIYSQYSRPETMAKGTHKKVLRYFFSVSANDPIEHLTMNNLDKAFQTNPRFRYTVAMLCHRDSDLTAYDHYINMYKIQFLYKESLR